MITLLIDVLYILCCTIYVYIYIYVNILFCFGDPHSSHCAYFHLAVEIITVSFTPSVDNKPLSFMCQNSQFEV